MEQKEQPVRVRLPREGEMLGIVEQLHGYAKMRVKGIDGKLRVCRVPGKLMKSLWVRERNIVLIKPWEFQPDTKADVIYKYTRNQTEALKRRGLLKELEGEL